MTLDVIGASSSIPVLGVTVIGAQIRGVTSSGAVIRRRAIGYVKLEKAAHRLGWTALRMDDDVDATQLASTLTGQPKLTGDCTLYNTHLPNNAKLILPGPDLRGVAHGAHCNGAGGSASIGAIPCLRRYDVFDSEDSPKLAFEPANARRVVAIVIRECPRAKVVLEL